jgi:Fe2+ or Zn2+ uptake regulation protein
MSQDCNQALKLLTQYERLAAKYKVKLTENRVAVLDELRSQGQITSLDLPATLQRVFPGQFRGLTLNEVRQICQNS